MATKTIETLIKVSKYALDDKRKVLAAHFEELALLERKRKAIDEELAAEQAAARDDPSIGITYGLYANAIITRRDKLDADILVKNREVEIARDDVQEAFEEVKKYELALDRIRAEQAKERARIEEEELNEMGLNGFRRKQAVDPTSGEGRS
ncbi:MAG: hypothetical protein NXI16_15430 [Alphaproteobacteria bacterium]|nr:hypothetical protein [Alphaproteobacteria bacterium]